MRRSGRRSGGFPTPHRGDGAHHEQNAQCLPADRGEEADPGLSSGSSDGASLLRDPVQGAGDESQRDPRMGAGLVQPAGRRLRKPDQGAEDRVRDGADAERGDESQCSLFQNWRPGLQPLSSVSGTNPLRCV